MKGRNNPVAAGVFLRVLTSIVFILLLPYPNHARDKSKKPASMPVTKPENLVWPPPPQTARIRFIQQIVSVEDVIGRKKSGWMDRLAGVKPAESQKRLKKPYGVAVDSQGRIYVADSANRTVFVFDLTAKSVAYRGQRGTARLALPVGVAVDDRDRLFVSDSFYHQLYCYSPGGELLAAFGNDQLQRPGGIALDLPRRWLYVADAKAHRIAVFNIDSFALVKHIGGPSKIGEAEEGKFSAPSNVAVDMKGTLYVTDTWNNRIEIFDPDGKFVRAFGEQGVLPGNFVRPKGIAIDQDGHVYVADAEFNNFQILSPEGQPLLAVGTLGTEPGQFTLITGLTVDKHNRIYVTEQWLGRLQIFEYLPEISVSAGGGQKPQ